MAAPRLAPERWKPRERRPPLLQPLRPSATCSAPCSSPLPAGQARPRSGPPTSDARHRAIFGALSALAELGIGIDLVTVRAGWSEPGGLNVAGGVAYLAGLLDGVPRVDSVAEWAAILRQHAARREMAEAARSLYRQAVDMGTEPAEALDSGMRALLEIGARARPQGWPTTAS